MLLNIEELIQLIQSHLPVYERARTTVLSKSWQHAWSTNPDLSFPVVRGENSTELVDRTLKRYLRENISFEKLDLEIDINKWKFSLAEKLIGLIATKTCLKEFSLSVMSSYLSYDNTFTLSDGLLLCENLTKIRVHGTRRREDNCVRMTTSLHPVIKCVSLRELDLYRVSIREEALNHILSSCILLVKIRLEQLNSCNGLKTIKAKNLPFLYELTIVLRNWYSPALEISNVPNLRVFSYKLWGAWLPFTANAHSMSLSNVTELSLGRVVSDYACLDMITSGFPFLESLTLELDTWKLESFHFTCASIKVFSLVCMYKKKLSDIQVFAPKLVSFSFDSWSYILPDFLFPVSSLMQIELSLTLNCPVDVYFFVEMRDALTLAPKCNIRITYSNYEVIPLDIDMDDLRRRLLLPPATNVQQLDFKVHNEHGPSERSPFFDAFFEICHPKYVFA
ncbi:hypothetical protein LXL04_006979 [Taraxacum kok-saghyz]